MKRNVNDNPFNIIFKVFSMTFLLLILIQPIPAIGEFNWVENENVKLTNGPIYHMELIDDSVYMIGDFTHVGDYFGRTALIDSATGETDPDFPIVEGTVEDIIHDGNNGWYIYGEGGLTVNDVNYPALVHINSDNTVDAGFNPDLDEDTRLDCMIISPDGNTLYIAGEIVKGDTTELEGIIGINTQTGAFTSWSAEITGSSSKTVHTMDISADGSVLYAGGEFEGIGGEFRKHLAAINTTTGLATSWEPVIVDDIIDGIRKLALSVDGQTIYVSGYFDKIGGEMRAGLASINISSETVTEWDPDPNKGLIYQMEVNSDPTNRVVYVGGEYDYLGTMPRNHLASIDAVSGVITPFSPWLDNSNMISMDLSPDGSLLCVTGLFSTIGGIERNHLALVDARTGDVLEWDLKIPPERMNALAFSTNGEKILMGGWAFIGEAIKRKGFAIYDIDTGEISETGSEVDLEVLGGYHTSTINSDGSKLYIASPGITIPYSCIFSSGVVQNSKVNVINVLTGESELYNMTLPDPSIYCSKYSDYIARYNPIIKKLKLSSDDLQLFAGGEIYKDTINNELDYGVSYLDSISGEPAVWDYETYYNIFTMELSDDDSILYIGGRGSSSNGYKALYAVDPITGVDIPGWNPPDIDGKVYSLKMSLDGTTIYASGNFTCDERRKLAEFDALTGELTDWDVQPNSTVGIHIAPDNSVIYISGYFSKVNDIPQENNAAIDADTGELLPWTPDDIGRIAAISPDGSKMYVKISGHRDFTGTGLRVLNNTLAVPALTGFFKQTPGESCVFLEWEHAACSYNPVTYKIFVATTPGGQDFETPDYTTQETSIMLEGLSNGTPYYVVVRGESSLGACSENTDEAICTPSANIITEASYNHDFESITTTRALISGKPEGWAASVQGYGDKTTTYYLDDTEPYEGTYSALMETSGSPLDDDLSIASLTADNSFAVQKDHTYLVSAAIRRDQSQWVRMILFTAGYSMIMTENIDALDDGEGDSGWQRYALHFRAPANMNAYVRFDNMVTNDRTAGGSCRMWVDDVQVIDLGIETYADIYNIAPPPPQYGIRNSFFDLPVETEIRTIAGIAYSCSEMPRRWDMAQAIDNFNNDAEGYPVWGQTVPPLSDATGPAIFTRAKAADTSRPSWPAITPEGVRFRMDLDKGQRHVLSFSYGAAGDTRPLLRVFMVGKEFKHYASLFVDPSIGIPGNRMWPLSVHYTPVFEDDTFMVRFDNVTIGPPGSGGIHTDETTIYIDNAWIGVVE